MTLNNIMKEYQTISKNRIVVKKDDFENEQIYLDFELSTLTTDKLKDILNSNNFSFLFLVPNLDGKSYISLFETELNRSIFSFEGSLSFSNLYYLVFSFNDEPVLLPTIYPSVGCVFLGDIEDFISHLYYNPSNSELSFTPTTYSIKVSSLLDKNNKEEVSKACF